MDPELKERLDRLDNQHNELIAQHEKLIEAITILTDLIKEDEQ